MITQSTTKQAWDALPLESMYGYSLFLAYIKMPLGERSLRRVSVLAKKSLRNIEFYSSKYRWSKRARLYDLHVLKGSLEKPKNDA